MPRTRIPSPDDEIEKVLISNIKYELDMKGYNKNDLKEILGLRDPAMNLRYKEPRRFKVKELMIISRWLRIPMTNFFVKRVADKMSA